ncbi:MFS transporter [Paenibacillus pinisoli]|uniref:MFS transporter n=1 Tax=Paenibacillus pinisoli TaxID=1276110 RepID=A0A3A6PC51_9BACL|nr:MFS transporter [Paenibacillus pinisoli]RJX38107.1 MFS transporter [Paenibacillus pinisoli]
MNKQTLIITVLALGVFLTATSELVISGILPRIAADTGVSLAMAGQLITVYSLSFAISTPILIALTARMNRRTVIAVSLASFIAGSLLSAISTSIIAIMAARILLGASSGVYLVVALGAVSKLVAPERIGRAVGTIILGFSSAMILGVPIGIAIADWRGWQMIFVMLGLLSLLVGIIILRLLPEIEGDAAIPFKQQLKLLGSAVIATAFLISLFREFGGSVWMSYMTPYLQQLLGLRMGDIAIVMLVLGILGAIGSRMSGSAVDRWGTQAVLRLVLAANAAALALLPLAGHRPVPAFLLIGIFIITLFASGPAIQSHMIRLAPGSANLVLSLNTSIVHLGLAGGASAGGLLASESATFRYHPWLASSFILLGLASALLSFSYSRKKAAQKLAA